MATWTEGATWKLEVVRGRKPGQVYPLAPRDMVLGNAPTPPLVGIDLAGQEGPTARRMEPHHALMSWAGKIPSIRDLNSSCGTFVNRRRVLPGQNCPLRAGDEIQLGSVVLRLGSVEIRSTQPGETRKPETFEYVLEGGSTCRTWDDFLIISAQKWTMLGTELASGRIDTFLRSIGREDLLPRSAIAADADDRLDAWLASLPTVRPSRPELEIHPRQVTVRATPGGGIIRKSVRISNVGYRLLRSSARVEPSDITWLRLAPEFDDISFATIEESDLIFELIVPENLSLGLTAEIIVEGNGGSCPIVVNLEPRRTEVDDDLPTSPDLGTSRLLSWLDQVRTRNLILGSALSLMILRVVVALAGRLIDPPADPAVPGLAGVILAFAVMGLVVGALTTLRREEAKEWGFGGFAGACLGALVAAVLFATFRAVDPVLLGTWAASVPVVCCLWAGLGALLGGGFRLARRLTR